MTDDRSILVEALKRAAETYERHQREKTILAASPGDPEIRDPLITAIEGCEVYKAVAGQVIFSANSGVILQAPSLAVDAVYRACRPSARLGQFARFA